MKLLKFTNFIVYYNHKILHFSYISWAVISK